MTVEGELLSTPSPERVERSQLTAYMRWLGEERDLRFDRYHPLWQWSVEDLPGFWSSIVEFCDIPLRLPPSEVLVAGRTASGGVRADGARFFEGAQCNYVDAVVATAGEDGDRLAVIARDESEGRATLTYAELAALAGRIAAGLRRRGVTAGDRVAAALPNGIDAVAGFLAAASLGAIWSSCAPEFGASSMADRLAQIEPKVLVTTPSYRYGGREISLGERIEALSRHLPGAEVTTVAELAAGEASPLRPAAVDFSHPLWILYSSGTTGLPKPIVHSHGGIVLEHNKILRLHGDLGPGERFFWFSTTGWMMWNFLVGGLLTGATIVLYDGSPVHPDPLALFRMAAEEHVTYFGTSAPFIESCRRLGLRPRDALDCSSISTIGSTGAPLPPDGFAWAAAEVGDDVAVASVSGGTDVCTAFLAGCPILPVHAGELQCAALGAKVQALGPDGSPVTGEVGELVISAPMPSMPVSFWGDDDGSRLNEAYFAEYPGLWRHGDFLKETDRHSFVVYGRSDATLNRGGVRMGTAELYRVIEAIPSVADSLVVDTSALGRTGELIAFVVPAEPGPDNPGAADPEALAAEVRRRLREEVSPRHVPDRVITVAALPHTLNGKKVEVPVRRILLGASVSDALSRDSLADPTALDGLLAAIEAAGNTEGPR